MTATVPNDGTLQRAVTVESTITGRQVRLVALLYRGGVSDDPGIENAYRETHLLVNVSNRAN